MPVKLHSGLLGFERGPTRPLRPHAPQRARRACLVALAFLAACGDPDEGDDQPTTTIGNPAQNADAGIVDTGVVVMMNPVTPDAGTPVGFDAGSSGFDAGTVITPVVDAGGMVGPTPDAGASDAGNPAADAGAKSDAGGDGGACTLTYENFGKQFITTYCASCHSGPTAKRMVMLDTLAGVQKNKTAVKRLAVTNTTMPEGNPKPVAADRQKLGQWLDCGAM